MVRLSAGELRAALGDDRAAPRFIETVPRRGYRFIARTGDTEAPPDTTDPAIDHSARDDGVVVGRARERATITEWLNAAASGRRQIGFITGEAGIGKTTLVDEFLRGLKVKGFGVRGGDRNPVTPSPLTAYQVARGQCIQHFGGGEPYMPVLGALASLCRDSDGAAVKAILLKHAPRWMLRILAEHLNSRAGASTAHALLSATLFNLSDVEAALQHAEQARALFDPEAPALPNDVGIPSSILVASACGYFGLVARAREVSREALARADTLGTPFHRALATNLASQICMFLDDAPGAAPLAREAVEIATQYDLAAFRITATMVRAWCDVEAGHVDEGLTALRGAFEEHGATGQRYSTTCFSLILARAYLAAGDADSANQILDAALAFAAETGERVYEPELYRLKGLVLLTGRATRAQKNDAIGHLERAITIAAERKALLYELRATSSLCRVQKSARQRLARLVDRFDAGTDCTDLRAGRALLGATPRSRV